MSSKIFIKDVGRNCASAAAAALSTGDALKHLIYFVLTLIYACIFIMLGLQNISKCKGGACSELMKQVNYTWMVNFIP